MATKRKKKVNQNVILIVISILIILIIYFVVSIVNLFQKPADTVLIKKGELINYEEVTGYIIRNEDIIDTSSFDGLIKSEVQDATRVAKGATVMTYVSKSEEQLIDKISKLDEKIDKAIESQQTIFTSDVKAIDAEIETAIYSSIKNNINMDSLKENKKYLNEKIKKKAKIVGDLSPAGSELKSLIEERTKYETELNNSEKTLTSPKAGLISYRVDNLENVLTYGSISELTTENLNNLKANLNSTIPVNTKSVKIIDNFECYIAVPMNSEEAYNAKLNDTVYLRFKNTGDSLIQSTVEYISKEEENVLLVFKVRSNVEELTKYRKIGLDIVWWSSKGLKTNKDTVFYTTINIANLSGDSSASGDIIYESEEIPVSGDATIKLPTIRVKKAYYTDDVFVKILKETGDFMIIDNYTDTELRELGVNESIIENRATLKMYDEALVQDNKET